MIIIGWVERSDTHLRIFICREFTMARPYFSRWKRLAMPASIKYIARSPRIAKMLEVKTMNGSVVMAKIAGIESTANIRLIF